MAKIMQYTSSFGITMEASYWMLAQIDINNIDRSGRLIFYGFADQSAREAGKNPIGRKEYEITHDIYDDYFSATALINNQMCPYTAAYVLAVAIKDEQGVSFFENAADDVSNMMTFQMRMSI